MSFSPHLHVQRARVGSAEVRSRDVRQLRGEPVVAIALALAKPRLWGYLLDATLNGFSDGYSQPHDGRNTTRVHLGLRAAQNALRARIDALIGRESADVALLALACEQQTLTVIGAGPLRAYVFDRHGLRELSGSNAPKDGVLRTEPVWCATAVEPGDLVFAGPTEQFSAEVLSRVQELGPALDPGALAALLTANATGSALAAFRV